MKLIDKDALVAEIERLRRVRPSDSLQPTEENKLDWLAGKAFCIASLKVFLDTLEVKDVDLEKYYHEFLQKEWFGNLHVRTMSEMMAFTAKHFFELGLKVQKGEDV